jgi:hypothetical protein
MQEELVVLQPVLVKTQAEVAKMMVEITRDKASAAETKAKVEVEEVNANAKAADAKVWIIFIVLILVLMHILYNPYPYNLLPLTPCTTY